MRVAHNSGISMRNFDAMISLNATAGTTYQIALDSPVGPQQIVAERLRAPRTEWCYRSVISFNITKGSLANDNLADAKVITGEHHEEFIDLRYATREPGEPSHGGRSHKSAWWKWTAPVSGEFHAATISDIFDSEDSRTPGIAVYTGPAARPSFSQLVRVAQASNAGLVPGETRPADDCTPARAAFIAVAGTTYYIAVDLHQNGTEEHKGFRSGLFLGRAPANDHFANAAEIIGSRRTVRGHNVGATEEPGEPVIDPTWKKPGSATTSVWWKWTAPASGLTQVHTRGSFIYGELGVYTGGAVGSLLEITRQTSQGSPDNGWTYAERAELGAREVAFSAVAGTTYYFLVNGSAWDKQSQGPITLTVIGQPGKPLPPTEFAAARRTASRIDLSWRDNAVDESSYRIERAPTVAGPWREVFNSGKPDVTAWSDFSVSGPVHYRLRAEGPGGIGDWVYLSPTSPDFLRADQTGPGTVTLTWPPTVSETGYRVWMRAGGTGDFTVAAPDLPPGATRHRVTGLAVGVVYEFRVAALDGDLPRLPAGTEIVVLSPLEGWRRLHFGTPGGTGDAADAADPDGDGLANLLEFLLFTDPLRADAARALVPELVGDEGQLYLQIRYRRHAGAGPSAHAFTAWGVGAVLEAAAALDAAPWLTGESVFRQMGPPAPGEEGEETVTVRVLPPVAQPSGPFVRMRLQ